MDNNELLDIIIESLISKNQIISFKKFLNNKAVQIKTLDGKIINITFNEVFGWYTFAQNK